MFCQKVVMLLVLGAQILMCWCWNGVCLLDMCGIYVTGVLQLFHVCMAAARRRR